MFSADDRHQAEIAEGWKEAVKSRPGSHSFDLLHYNCMETTDIFVILDILDRIHLGVFDVVTIVPPCSTWSRARHKETEGQKPLRSRSCPLGLPALSLLEQRKVDQANECLELGVWLAQQALSCETKQTDLLLLAPEDFGGEAIHGPTAIWQFKELHDLGALNEAQRAAGFLCQLSKADQQRPLGFISTLPTFRELLHSGWLQLDLIGDTLQYSGPLPKDCPCATTHKPMVGLSEGKFWFSISPTPGEQFWHTYSTAFFKKPFSLREGGLVQKVSNSEGYPLAARSGSWHSLLCLWKNGGLNRTILRDWIDTLQVDTYFGTCISSSPASSTRSRQGATLFEVGLVSRRFWCILSANLTHHTEGPIWTTGRGPAGYTVEYHFSCRLRGSWVCVRDQGHRALRMRPWLQWSRGEMAMSLACCVLLRRPRIAALPNAVR